MMYARGNDDEKVHKAYHKSYFEGVSFKGWRNETVIARSEGGNRVILATNENSYVRNSKVKELITVMEKELGFGEGKLLYKLCTVYLYISGQKIVGGLVTNPIKTALRVIPSSTEENHSDLLANNTELGKTDYTLEFGKISFKREIIRMHNHSIKEKEEYWDHGAIICETEAVPALCGFRAIWVVSSRRRKGIGSKLMDVARKTFCEGGSTLRISQFAFPPPKLLWEGTSTELLQGQCILSIQRLRCTNPSSITAAARRPTTSPVKLLIHSKFLSAASHY